MKAKASSKLELANALHDAFQEQQFSIVYQPFGLGRGRNHQFEALIRRRHPEIGDVAPLSSR
jgi:EAL domain-containing protein (putative c-di-GMP-specific phosphodiesterase class I)